MQTCVPVVFETIPDLGTANEPFRAFLCLRKIRRPTLNTSRANSSCERDARPMELDEPSMVSSAQFLLGEWSCIGEKEKQHDIEKRLHIIEVVPLGSDEQETGAELLILLTIRSAFSGSDSSGEMEEVDLKRTACEGDVVLADIPVENPDLSKIFVSLRDVSSERLTLSTRFSAGNPSWWSSRKALIVPRVVQASFVAALNLEFLNVVQHSQEPEPCLRSNTQNAVVPVADRGYHRAASGGWLNATLGSIVIRDWPQWHMSFVRCPRRALLVIFSMHPHRYRPGVAPLGRAVALDIE
ncbi:hypothetical protein BU15DRAFT_67109 [Melanogaster broomeanus]|nr:hypothetical protein BU15DRAFT_67109 [Melanogaster broomeanus]